MPNFLETVSGNMQGKFYGPNAEEVAGEFNISTTTYVGVGNFIGKQ